MGWKLVECWIFSKEKLKGFESIDIFNEKLKLSECSRGLQDSLSLPILEENLLFAKIKSATFSGRGNVDQVIAERRMLNRE